MNVNSLHPVNTDTKIEKSGDAEPEETVSELQLAMMLSGDLQLDGALRSDVGAVRQRNEDSCLLYSFDSGGHTALPPFALYIVADGMGGHDGGDRASKVASRVAADYLLQRIYLPLLNADEQSSQGVVEQIMRESVLAAHEAVNPADYSGYGGTTLTIALILGRQLYLAHVGDSRAYWLIDGNLQALTRDHSLVQRLQDSGRLTAEEAENFQYRNILLRALGQEEELEVDVYVHTLPLLGKLLLCSDGLCGQINDSEISQIMRQALSPDRIADQLITAALDAGGLDNISAIVVEFKT